MINKKKYIVEEDIIDKKPKVKTIKGVNFDYTPLFKFLLSKVNEDWDEIYSEVKSRLNSEKPIWWLVYKDKNNQEITRIGESTYYHSLYIDEDNKLQYINKNATLKPTCCKCYTRTLNGKVIKSNEK